MPAATSSSFPAAPTRSAWCILEALACGLTVAAYPVEGPRDVVGEVPVAALDDDLIAACMSALKISREAAREFALTQSWRACTLQFLSNLAMEMIEP